MSSAAAQSINASEGLGAPLLADEPAQGLLTLSITCHGQRATITLGLDGLTYTPLVDVTPSQPMKLLCCGRVPSHLRPHEIPSERIVGAALVGPSSAQVWHVEPVKGSERCSSGPSVRLLKSQPFDCGSGQDAAKLVEETRRACCWWGLGRPPRVYAIINPVSGRGRSLQMFRSELLPVLEDAAGMEVVLHTTRGPGHAAELLGQLDLASVDLLVFVGGDGTVYEGVQGLLARPDWDAARRMPLAHVPSGSGNGIARSCGLRGAATAAYALVKRHTHPLDVVSVVHAPGQRCFAVLSLTYGLLSNLDGGTEALRCLGEARFTLGAIWEAIKLRQYKARIAWLPDTLATTSSSSSSPPSAARAPAGDSAAANGADSGAGGDPGAALLRSGQQASGSYNFSEFDSGPPLQLLPQLGSLPLGLPDSWQPPPQWRLMQEPTNLWAVYNIPYAAENYKSNPWGDLSTGHMDMMWTQGLKGFGGLVSSLDMLAKAETGAHADMDIVQHDTVRAMVFEPQDERTQLYVDGELLPVRHAIALEVHPGLLTMVVNPLFVEEGAAGAVGPGDAV